MEKTTEIKKDKMEELDDMLKRARRKMEKNEEHKETIQELDIDSVLLQAVNVRASISVMNGAIDWYFANGNCNYWELQALVFHIEKISEMNLRDIDNIIEDLKKSGATTQGAIPEQAAC